MGHENTAMSRFLSVCHEPGALCSNGGSEGAQKETPCLDYCTDCLACCSARSKPVQRTLTPPPPRERAAGCPPATQAGGEPLGPCQQPARELSPEAAAGGRAGGGHSAELTRPGLGSPRGHGIPPPGVMVPPQAWGLGDGAVPVLSLGERQSGLPTPGGSFALK